MSDHAVRTATTVAAAGDDALTIDMIGQMAYCPRRFHLMYVEGRWADNFYTLDGLHAHRRVDAVDHLLPDAGDAPRPRPRDDGDEPPKVSRSVPLASERLGLTGKLDLVATADAEAVPVETKRRRVPENAERSYETTRVQLMCQGLLLREHGYACRRGVVYYAASRTRVDVPFTDELEATALRLIGQVKRAVSLTVIPEPLEDSPKCNGCSLSGICMPDETLALRDVKAEIDDEEGTVRRLYPPRDDATAAVRPGAGRVRRQGPRPADGQEAGRFARRGAAEGRQPARAVRQRRHQRADDPVAVRGGRAGRAFVGGHWFYGVTRGITLRNAYDRAAQFDAAAKPHKCLAFAKQIVLDKVAKQRTMLRRNAPVVAGGRPGAAGHGRRAEGRADGGGFGRAARPRGDGGGGLFPALRPDAAAARLRRDSWDFTTRNRRPPKDPVNALLSFAYAMLVKECTTALLAEGLDPFWGFYHQPRHGRPALALDLMEPLRPTVADSAVLTAVNTGMVVARDFEANGAGCVLRPAGRRGIIRAYEARLDQTRDAPGLRLPLFVAQRDPRAGPPAGPLAPRRRAAVRERRHPLRSRSVRRRYLITYDVSDDKRRTALFHRLCDAGDHAQFSVFFAELTAAELARFRGEASADRASRPRTRCWWWIWVGRTMRSLRDPLSSGIEAIGKCFEPDVRVRVV